MVLILQNFTEHQIDGLITVQYTNSSLCCWLNSALVSTLFSLRGTGALPPFRGNLPVPRDGIDQALIAWAQVKQTTVVDSDVFKQLYLRQTGGDSARYRTGVQYSDQFFQVISHTF